jgi:hypothetical protein
MTIHACHPDPGGIRPKSLQQLNRFLTSFEMTTTAHDGENPSPTRNKKLLAAERSFFGSERTPGEARTGLEPCY